MIEKELQSVDLEVLYPPSLPRMQSAQQLRKGSVVHNRGLSAPPTVMECTGDCWPREEGRWTCWGCADKRRWLKADWFVWPFLLHLCEGMFSMACLLHGEKLRGWRPGRWAMCPSSFQGRSRGSPNPIKPCSPLSKVPAAQVQIPSSPRHHSSSHAYTSYTRTHMHTQSTNTIVAAEIQRFISV